MPGRTDNEIKNYWNTHIRKRLLRNGIDPVTHAPRLDLLDLSSILSSPHLNLSNLLRLQTLLNPLALTLLSSNVENPNILLQKLQENQLLDSHNLNNQTPTFQPNQFENLINQQNPSNLADSSLPNPPPSAQNNLGQLPTTSPSTSDQVFQNYCPTNENGSNYFYGVSDRMKVVDLSENSSFESVMSTPSASTFINGGTEDEKESFCSNLLRFEIPESLDQLDYFM